MLKPQLRQHLSAPGLLKTIRHEFSQIKDPSSSSNISLADCLMSGMAIFGLKYPSLLQFDQDKQAIASNLRSLYGNMASVSFNMNIPTLKTPRLVLKEVTVQDIPAYKEHFIDYEIIRNLAAGVPWPYPEDGVESFLNEFIFPNQGKERWMWGIHLKSNPNELIGAVDLWRAGEPENRGFWLSRQHWNKGIMTEAVTPINDYAFDQLGFERLIFSNAKGNTQSRRIKEKTGAQYLRTEATSFVDSTYTEHEIWGLTKEEWQKCEHKANKVLQGTQTSCAPEL